MNNLTKTRVNLKGIDWRSLTHHTVTDEQRNQMSTAVATAITTHAEGTGKRPTTIAIAPGWWVQLREYLKETLGLVWCKYIPEQFGKPFSTVFSVGEMPRHDEPSTPIGVNPMSIDIASQLLKLEDDDQPNIAAQLMAMSGGVIREEEVEESIIVTSEHPVTGKDIDYEFLFRANGSLVVNKEKEIAFIWLLIDEDDEDHELAVLFTDQPNMVYIWDVIIDSVYNETQRGLLGQYIKDTLAIDDDENGETMVYDEFVEHMQDEYNVDVTAS